MKIIHSYSRYTKIPPSYVPFLFETLGDTNYFGPNENIHFGGPKGFQMFQALTVRTFFSDPNFILIPNYQHVILCFELDVGTIITKNHSHFLVDLGSIFRIFRIYLTDLHHVSVPIFSISKKWISVILRYIKIVCFEDAAICSCIC